MDLFTQNSQLLETTPLAERLRPKSFDEVLGQNQILGQEKMRLLAFQKGQFQSLILWGPPGCGKTSFASVLLEKADAETFKENAIDLGTKRIRELGESSKNNLIQYQKKTIVFVDEIHRLNKGQQDVLLPFIEKGYFFLIGATTENPSYQLNSALQSRCRLLVFEPLKIEDLKPIFYKACASEKIESDQLLQSSAESALFAGAHGDARKLLNLAEELFIAYKNDKMLFPMDNEGLQSFYSSTGLRFDQKGDEHYDTISAFIKSIRGSDADGGVYYLARMLEGGEDPVFIARRLIILASEDVGNGDPRALGIAVSGLEAVKAIGLPEAEIILSQIVTYLASAPKSNRSYQAIKKARTKVRETGPLPIPKALRSAQTSLMASIGYGKGYKYSHDGATGWLAQEYLPEALRGEKFYEPSDRGFEKQIQAYQDWVKQTKKADI